MPAYLRVGGESWCSAVRARDTRRSRQRCGAPRCERAAARASGRAAVAGRGSGRPGEGELAELFEAAVVGRAGEAGAEVAARHVRAEAGAPEGAARGDDEAHGPPGQRRPARARIAVQGTDLREHRELAFSGVVEQCSDGAGRDSRGFGRRGHGHDVSTACGLAFRDLGDEVPYSRESEVRAVTEDGVARAGKAHEAGGFRRQVAD